jgi:L-histidine Nalpha-methyltransferase / hercynylcysteine S-oxide synthase
MVVLSLNLALGNVSFRLWLLVMREETLTLYTSALRKTSLILKALQENRRNITYYALDLDLQELERSLSSLGTFDNVKLVGLLGTYDDGVEWLSTKFDKSTPKTIMWLGSSVGNLDREEAGQFIGRIQEQCMMEGDNFFIGIDQRNDPQKIALAYNEPAGITREFIMNGLDHINDMLEQPFIDRNNFEYISDYRQDEGRHVAHYKAVRDCVLKYRPSNGALTQIVVIKDEMIYVESSYKYSPAEMDTLVDTAGLDFNGRWTDSQNQYSMLMAEKRPFHFARGLELKREQDKADFPGVPSEHAWNQLWKSWDLVTQTVLTKDMMFERPIALRHFFIFYIGHIPAFLDIQISRALEESYTEPTEYVDIFERGIDPDMDDPSICNPHSEVPVNPEDWPKLDAIIEYSHRVRQRVRSLMQDCATGKRHMTKRLGRIIWLTHEHEAMHLETLLYMLVQSPNIHTPSGVKATSWDIHATTTLSNAPLHMVHAGSVTVGHDDIERLDDDQDLTPGNEFGWDNENPKRQVAVNSFKIQSRPVTNGEYYTYLKESDLLDKMPCSWLRSEDGQLMVKTVFGPCPLEAAADWPVSVSGYQAEAYAASKGMRLPTEHELIHFREQYQHHKDVKAPNIGFSNWHPTNVDNNNIHLLGDVWEWTSSVWDTHDGFETSIVYPGYSADFFDGKHNVVLGGSWATLPIMAERRSFRNWYQRAYPYVFAGFRCAV